MLSPDCSTSSKNITRLTYIPKTKRLEEDLEVITSKIAKRIDRLERKHAHLAGLYGESYETKIFQSSRETRKLELATIITTKETEREGIQKMKAQKVREYYKILEILVPCRKEYLKILKFEERELDAAAKDKIFLNNSFLNIDYNF